MRLLLLMFPILVATACSRVHPFPEAERAEIDCLAAITVVRITDDIRAARQSGASPSEIEDIRKSNTDEALQRLEARYPGRMDEAYLEFDINNKLARIEAAMEANTSSNADDQFLNETLSLGRTCTFGEE